MSSTGTMSAGIILLDDVCRFKLVGMRVALFKVVRYTEEISLWLSEIKRMPAYIVSYSLFLSHTDSSSLFLSHTHSVTKMFSFSYTLFKTRSCLRRQSFP